MGTWAPFMFAKYTKHINTNKTTWKIEQNANFISEFEHNEEVSKNIKLLIKQYETH